MTDAEWASFLERIDALAPDINTPDSLVLTDAEKDVIARLDEDILAFIEEQLSAYVPQSIDVRTELALKGIAALFENIPVLADAARVGYEAGDE
jgi:hypothetical protein